MFVSVISCVIPLFLSNCTSASARQLIAANARADAKADSGATALTLAARNRDEAMLRHLFPNWFLSMLYL